MNQLLKTLQSHAQRQPQTIAIHSLATILNYGELAAKIKQLSSLVSQLDVQRVGLYADNSAQWILIDLAATALGITVVPLPLHFTVQQMAHAITTSDLDGVFSDRENVVKIAAGELQHHGIVCGDMVFHYRRQLPQTERLSVDCGDAMKITYTSGSTGKAKGVCLSDEAIGNVADSLANVLRQAHVRSHLCLLPFSTLLENIAGVYAQLSMGNTVYVEETAKLGLTSNHDFCARTLLNALREREAQCLILLPQMLKNLLEQPDNEILQTLKFIAVGGGKVSPELILRARQQGLAVYEGYGLSECASVVCLNAPQHDRAGSVGQPLPHARVRIEDDGEIVVGGNAMLGYLGDQGQQAEIFTGDIGYIDAEDYLYVTGRKKNAIISSFGRNISPEWVESVFLCEPEIAQIAVFGEARPSLSAVITPAAGTSGEQLQAAMARVNRSLPDYARILHWALTDKIFHSDTGELTANGKLCRSVIYQRYRTSLEQSEQESA